MKDVDDFPGGRGFWDIDTMSPDVEDMFERARLAEESSKRRFEADRDMKERK